MKFNEIKKHLKKFSVGIAGAGGLGSNCAMALARTGIGRLIIADFDIVEEGNLNRQYFFADQVGMKKTAALKDNIARIDYGTKVVTHDLVLTADNIAGVFGDCNIIVEAFDRNEMKQLLTETVIDLWPGRPLILASGLAGYGRSNILRQEAAGENLIVCGDQESEVSEQLPPLAPRVGIVANMQANVVVELLMKMKDHDY